MFRKLLLLLCLLPLTASGFNLAYVVDDDTAWSNLGWDTLVVNFFSDRMGYNVTVFPDSAVPGYTTWVEDFDGIVISDLISPANSVASLKDVPVPVLVLGERFGDNNFGLATDCWDNVRAGASNLVIEDSLLWLHKQMNDEIVMNGGASCGYESLAAGAITPYNIPAWVGTARSITGFVPSGGTLTSGTAPANRAFTFHFWLKGSIAWLHPWELLGNLSAYTFGDTLNNYIGGYAGFAGEDECDNCWGEFSGDSTNSQANRTYTRLRFGWDSIRGISWAKINNLARKVLPGFKADSLAYTFFGTGAEYEAPPSGDLYSGFDFTVTMHKALVTGWHCPQYGGPEGNPVDDFSPDSTWLNRSWAIPTSVAWGDVDMEAGVDYVAEPIDSFHFNAGTFSVGDSVKFVVSASELDDAIAGDGNLYLVFKTTPWNTNDSADIEISTRWIGDQTYSDATRAELFCSPLSVQTDDLTPSIRIFFYLTGADWIDPDEVFQHAPADKTTFFRRCEDLVGVGSGMAGYLDEAEAHDCQTSIYTSLPDMPVWNGLSTTHQNDNQIGRKHRFITDDDPGEIYWLHYYDETVVSGRTIPGTGSMTIVDGDSISRVNHYPDAWGGNTYTYPTRPVFNFTDYNARQGYFGFLNALMNDSSDIWFPEKTAGGNVHYQQLYFDNSDAYRTQTFTATSGGTCVELSGELIGSEAARVEYWDSMKVFLQEARAINPSGSADDSLRLTINVGSGTWNDDYCDPNEIPQGTKLNFEFLGGFLQVKAADANTWTVPKLHTRDSTAAANGISFLYCSAPWERVNSTYLSSGIWNYHGISSGRWSVNNRMCLYLMTRSDSSELYVMPDFWEGAYKGYAFDGDPVYYYDYATSEIKTATNQSFDTLAWAPCLEYDFGDPVGYPELDTSYAYSYGGSGYTAKIFRREYDNAWIFGRPLDGQAGDVPWGRKGADAGLTVTVELPEECRLLLPNGTLTDSSFTWYQLNPADGFAFIKVGSLEQPPDVVKPRSNSVLNRNHGLLNRK